MPIAKDGKPNSEVKKMHLALAGLITVLVQVLSELRMEHTIREQVALATHEQFDRLKETISDGRLTGEKEFVRKEDVAKLADEIHGVKAEVSKLEGFIKGVNKRKHDDFWSANETKEEHLVSLNNKGE